MTPGELSISSRSSDLLNIVLYALRHIIVDDRLDITLVNAHTECNSADKTLDLIGNEKFLDCVSLLIGLTCMVRLRVYPILLLISVKGTYRKNTGKEITGSLMGRIDEDAI